MNMCESRAIFMTPMLVQSPKECLPGPFYLEPVLRDGVASRYRHVEIQTRPRTEDGSLIRKEKAYPAAHLILHRLHVKILRLKPASRLAN